MSHKNTVNIAQPLDALTGRAALPSTPQQPPFGRIRLDQVIDAWSASSAFNPRLLACELAALLRTLAPASQPIADHAVTVVVFDSATGPGSLSFGTLAAYFEHYSAEGQQGTIETTKGSARAGAVYLAKSWIGQLEIDTEARARIAAGLQQAHPAPRPSGGAQTADQHQPPMSGSDPECLALHQAQQRQAGERSAAEQLEVFEQRALLAEREVAKLQAKEQALEYSRQQALAEAEQERRSSSEERRQRTLIEDKLREHAGIIEFMNPENQLSPEPGRRLVAAWCELTKNGTYDVVTETGTGLKEHCRRWLTSNLGAPAEVVLKRFVWALAWPARKKGGMVAKRQTEKG